MRTYGQAKAWMAEQLHEDETDTVLSATVLPRWVSQARDKILRYMDWPWNRGQRELTWPSAGANGSILYLPSYIDKIITLSPGSIVGVRSVMIVTPTELDRYRPVAGRQPGRDYLVVHGLYGVEADMPAAGVITATSSGGATNQTARVEGLDANGRDQTEDIAVTAGGANAGTATFAAGVEGVRRITLIGDGTGTPVTDTGVVTFTSGGTTLERLDSAVEVGHEHWRTELHALADSGGAYQCRYIKRHYPPLRDQDIIDVPEYFHDLMEIGMAIQLAKFRQRMEEVTVLKADWKEAMLEARAWSGRQPGQKHSFRIIPQWGRRRAY